MAKKMIAFCGLDCGECDAFRATQKNDGKLRAEVAAKWSKQYGAPLKPEDINCVGCAVKAGAHVGHWAVCDVRLCGQAKDVANCAYCPEYGCDKLAKYHQMAPQMKANLEAIRTGLGR